ncbi:transcription termination/antitermination protein NusG [Tunicatimonas pelagia]|uniref:transcription termination/antitermination protein NusG n=1 Tax=Tunicatimonas pelagia TaxID=931531 RepID=UPI0026650B99|nr:transcription termination/antitermination protein NusG [Tunicatimonas pelagia]WKN42242.1 transcription termination/antitermination protein NusG [Tunicatimonas pelagia]
MVDPKWYVIRAVSGKERKVREYLEHEIKVNKLEEFVPQVIIPSEKVMEMRNGKKRVRERQFFPGYILVSADLKNGEVLHMINNVPNVIGFLSAKGTSTARSQEPPVPLRESEINRILGRVDEAEEEDIKMDTPYIVGEEVKVMDGPFSGFIGNIEEIFEERRKLKVMVKIFGRNTPVELNYMQVEKVDNSGNNG